MDLHVKFQKLLLENLDKNQEIPSVSDLLQKSSISIDQNSLVGVLKSLVARNVLFDQVIFRLSRMTVRKRKSLCSQMMVKIFLKMEVQK